MVWVENGVVGGEGKKRGMTEWNDKERKGRWLRKLKAREGQRRQ